MAAGVQPHLPARGLLPAGRGIVGHLLAAAVAVVGPAVEQQTEGGDGVAGLSDRHGPNLQFGLVEPGAGTVGAGDHDEGGSTSFTTLAGSLSRSRAVATLPVLSASLITSGR